MNAFILSAILAFSALFAPLTASQPVSQPVSSVTCEEDMTCWNADTMGNGESNSMATDAWDTIDRSGIDSKDYSNMMLSYVDTRNTDTMGHLPMGQFAVASNTMANVSHVFQWDRLAVA